MDDEITPTTGDQTQMGERQTASLLVRCWLEPREDETEAPVVRGYVKNLKTGEEILIKDLDSVGRQILHYLSLATPAVAESFAKSHAAR